MLVCPVVDPLYTEEKIVKTDENSGWDKENGSTKENGRAAVKWNDTKQYEVYLPAGTAWYDYWTNQRLEGGQTLKADAPLAHSPLYVKAGSILPIGQDLQYCNEKAWDNITLRIYPGANATFTLYEDEGDGYNYLKGQYSEIEMQWNDKSCTLTLAARHGSYPGMLVNRTFVVTLPDGSSKTIKYKGKKVSVKM